MKKIKKIVKKIILLSARFLSDFSWIVSFSKKIVDNHFNDNQCELESNGELRVIQNNSKKFKLVFDVGANIGDWTSLILRACPHATVYSFEPSKKTFETLSHSITSSRAHLYNVALGEKEEDKDFYIYGENSVFNSTIKRDIHVPGEDTVIEKVKFTTVDIFCKENNIDSISFLKIDTEGNEMSVLLGAEKFITEGKIDMIQFEYGGTYLDAGVLLKDVFAFFKDKPYSIHKVMRNDLKLCKEYMPGLETFNYSNFVAILNK